MVYRNDIPQGADRPSSPSRGQILENFSQLDSQYGTSGDHVEFSAATNNGKHKKSTYIATSDPTTQPLEGAVYTKDAGSGRTELYYRRESSGQVLPITFFKAYGLITGISVTNDFNISKVTNPSAGRYVINLSNSITGSFGVIATPATPSGGGFPNITISYVPISSSEFELRAQDTQNSRGLNVPSFTVLVMQV
jgi:hypothetical protein